ncbi:MAG TPA: two-component system response regulator [Methylococcaceae bacterium]|nr:two-component system response regulator [Methylococcaceae bacterium]
MRLYNMSDKVILLVEDNEDGVTLMLRALQDNNITNKIEVVRDGEEALDYLFARGKHSERDSRLLPRIILLDLKLPKLDGLEVLKQIRGIDQTRLTPVVILTSSKESCDLEASYRLGANSYIQKPLDFARFVEAVREIAGYWLNWNETAIT